MTVSLRLDVHYLPRVFPSLDSVSTASALVPLLEAAKEQFLTGLAGRRVEPSDSRQANWGEAWYDLEPLGCGPVWLLVQLDNLEVRYAGPVFMARALVFQGPERPVREAYKRFTSFLCQQSLRQLKAAAAELLKDRAAGHYILLDIRRLYGEPVSEKFRSF